MKLRSNAMGNMLSRLHWLMHSCAIVLTPTIVGVALAQSQLPPDTETTLLEHDKNLLFTRTSRLLGETSDDLLSKIAGQQKNQRQLEAYLCECVEQRPANAREESILRHAALLLGHYGNSRCLRCLSQNLDLDTLRHTNTMTLSSERSLGSTMLRHPCVRALVLNGEEAVRPVLKATLSQGKRSDLELELAAYALLEIRFYTQPEQGGYGVITRNGREALLKLADSFLASVPPEKRLPSSSIAKFERYVTEVEPYLYRHGRKAGEKRDMKPPAGSAVFKSDQRKDEAR